MKPLTIVLGGYGFNADAELAEAFRMVGSTVERVHLSDLLAEPGLLDRAGILAFPGGFSFGDHLGSGQVVALLCRRSLGSALAGFVARGGAILGICNGFQVLTKIGILPGGGSGLERQVTLTHNSSGSFVDGWVDVRFERNGPCVWTTGVEDRMLPVRHGEGRFVTRDTTVLQSLEAGGLVALRYTPQSNPNGSVNDIAGICDPSGRILGLMPHPEAFLVPENHPHRRHGTSDRPALELFANGVRAVAAAS